MKSMVIRQSPGLFIALVLYGLGAVIGGQVPKMPVLEEIDSNSISQPLEFSYFVAHNIPIILFTAAGVLTLGFVTMFFLLFNGAVVSSVLLSAQNGGILQEALAGMVVHGSFEIVGLLLAGAVGFVPISAVCRIALGYTVNIKTELKDALYLLLAALLLTVVAGMFEAWVTPSVLEWKIGGK